MKASPSPVLVVGAGPVGLTMACELRRYGVPCRIIDKAEGPATTSRALTVHALTLESFAALGISGAARKAGRQVKGFRFCSEREFLARVSFADLPTPFPFVLSLPQSETEGILADRLGTAGGRVEWRTELVALDQQEEKVSAILDQPGKGRSVVSTPWLIGCDGAHSTVRHQLQLPFEGERYDEVFALADARVQTILEADHGHAFFSSAGVLAMIPLPAENEWRLIADLTGTTAAEDEGDPDLGLFRALVRERGPAGMELGEARWLSRFRINRRMVPGYRVKRCLLAGDAAHIHSPVGGQGMNIGIQDAANLAWKLALVIGKAAPETLLDSYDAERRPVARRTLTGTDMATRAITLRGRMASQIRDRLVSFLNGIPAVQRRMASALAELDLDYRDSSLVDEDEPTLARPRSFRESGAGELTLEDRQVFDAAPRPGERVPARLLDPEEERLFSLLDPRRHTLLLLGGENLSGARSKDLSVPAAAFTAEWERWIKTRLVCAGKDVDDEVDASGLVWPDPSGELHAAFGARAECLYLIRPDGFIGFRSLPVRFDRLLIYLERIFSPRAE